LQIELVSLLTRELAVKQLSGG